MEKILRQIGEAMVAAARKASDIEAGGYGSVGGEIVEIDPAAGRVVARLTGGGFGFTEADRRIEFMLDVEPALEVVEVEEGQYPPEGCMFLEDPMVSADWSPFQPRPVGVRAVLRAKKEV